MSIIGHYLLLENWPAHFQSNWFPEAEFLGPPGDTYVPHHNGLGEPLSLDIKSIKTSEFYGGEKSAHVGGRVFLRWNQKYVTTLKHKFTFQFLKTNKKKFKIYLDIKNVQKQHQSSYISKNVHYHFFAN